MQTVLTLRVPLKVDVKSGDNWAECEPWGRHMKFRLDRFGNGQLLAGTELYPRATYALPR